MAIVGQIVAPLLTINFVNNSAELAPHLTQANSFVGVEFPDSYQVRCRSFVSASHKDILMIFCVLCCIV